MPFKFIIMNEINEEREKYKNYFMDTYKNSEKGKLINSLSQMYPKEDRRYSIDGKELIYVIWMEDEEQPENGRRCIAIDYNWRQIDSIIEYFRHLVLEKHLSRFKFKMDCMNMNELQTVN